MPVLGKNEEKGGATIEVVANAHAIGKVDCEISTSMLTTTLPLQTP